MRDFFGPTTFNPLDLTQTSFGWFATRYVTHFCAPIFVFLAGVSASLYGGSVKRSELAVFLVTRGMWLVLLECTVVSLSWGALWGGVITLQVIWALGVSMMVLAGVVFLGRPAQCLLALVLVAGHNLLDGLHAEDLGVGGGLWSLLHAPGFHNLGIVKVFVLYPLVPWVGVMVAGYWAAPLLWGVSGAPLADAKRAQTATRRLVVAGLGLLLLMVLLRIDNVYGNPEPWLTQARGAVYSAMSFINFSKYPPSLLYLCMTLGLGALLLGALLRCPARYLQVLLVFGKVPMFFYLVHLPLIHIGSHVWSLSRFGQPGAWGMTGGPAPESYAPDLGFVYGVWALYLLLMYPACRW
ncbi:MAG: hypothetical protein CFE44_00380 [Burkholderiales bacterium PBB4]|nr:MAG: hypothetical protein CFE44_00380 [Burkholderiales bacterium PBB4]